jgi:hypothetical protein
MSIHDEGTKHPAMSAIANVDEARGFARRLEKIERQRSGAPLEIVRPAVARKIGVAPGTLENIARGRVKDVRKGVFDSLKAGLIKELQAEMRRYEFELQCLLQTGADPRSPEIAEVEAGLAQARQALGLNPDGGGA